MAAPVDKINVLRAAILMAADSMLTELRAIPAARTIEEAHAPVNLIIERVMALSEAAEMAVEEEPASNLSS